MNVFAVMFRVTELFINFREAWKIPNATMIKYINS